MDLAAAFAGAFGGFILGLGVLALNLIEILRSSTPVPRIRQAIGAHLAVAMLLALIGGVCAHFLTGQAGDFLQGITGFGFLLLLGGSAMSARQAAHA
ncbi:hypothetical protein [Arthrobacter sp. IK3]|uniref:hypothetical protein n=1 Tax=Arthrobacter sp. IK3 TaxID=3448169 RepID=UPI003EE257D6